MGLLDGKTHKQYYTGNDLGGYQFTSLDDIITQFEIAYVGENKIIPKIKRSDIAFHAKRAMQELSFDTFKSIKSQQIDLPPSLKMILPHDYVNYTKVSWADSSGIKHPLYRTNSTSNPFQVRQNDSGAYSFPSGYEMVVNNDFSSVDVDSAALDWVWNAAGGTFENFYLDSMGITNGALTWSYVDNLDVSIAYQAIDVSDASKLTISADGVVRPIEYTNTLGTTGTAVAYIRFGLTSVIPDVSDLSVATGTLDSVNMFDLFNSDGDSSYVEWNGLETSTKTLEDIDVSSQTTVYVVALSFISLFTGATPENGFSLNPSGTIKANLTAVINVANINSLDNLSVTNSLASSFLQPNIGNEKNSSTWNNYKSITPSENNNDNYEDDTYWPMAGERYGLSPQHAQVNGSFFIDNRLGNIHFSSNISGKTVILDYISDSLGTDAEMQVHKFAEDAMYKWIAHAVLSTSAYGQPLVPRLTKEKFAAVRKAKLRLSDVKIEELTQILRGKSKQIKH